MSSKPNLFVLGAPKCGTTSIAHWLDQHPNVHMHNPKEPHSLDSAYAYPDKVELSEYLSNMAQGADKAWRGEASTWYLRSAEVIDRILSMSPDARFVVCLRNPVDMAVSLHNQFVQHGLEPRSDFWDSWDAWEDRAMGRNIPQRHPNPEYLNYRHSCALGEMAEALLHRVNAENVLFLRLDEIAQSPLTVYESLCSFLSIGALEIDLSPQNQAIERRSIQVFHILKSVLRVCEQILPKSVFRIVAYAAWRLNTRPAIKREIPTHTRERLGKEFDQEIHRLEKATGFDLSAWRRKNGVS